MTKWIWGLAAVVAIVSLVVLQRNGTKTAYVNGLPEYTMLPGREYIFERDCYVFKARDRKSSYPLVGANAPDLGNSVPYLPTTVTEKSVGTDNGKVRILDVVRTGTRFRIVSVRRDQTRNETTISLEILLLPEDQHKYPRLDAFYILDHSPETHGSAPAVITGYAVERVKL
ncbi:hypothetical protein DB347_14850 [Opitutaceae bacterium EW11]|nr:hypothetical protein DB347_14850 [Opitutaceae bacterium EW11]